MHDEEYNDFHFNSNKYYFDGEEQAAEDPAVEGASVMAPPRSHFGGQAQDSGRSEISDFDANCGDACECRYPLGGILLSIFAEIGL
jgi:hypothetical protein